MPLVTSTNADVGPPLWTKTPLLYSSHISARLGCDAYLKLENLQPSQSFKYRGVSLWVQHALATRGPNVRLVVASSGNGGLAAACAARALGLSARCTVYMTSGAGAGSLDLVRKQGVQLVVVGASYPETLKAAEVAVAEDPDAVMVPVFDDPILWQGHSSMIAEIAEQLPAHTKPAGIFCSVGGGGLLGGVIRGCEQVGWDDVPLVTLEPRGSNCFYHSLAINDADSARAKAAVKDLPEGAELLADDRHGIHYVRMNELKSVVSSLGAASPAPGVVAMALLRKADVRCICVPDEMSMQVALTFADEHKMLVELACSTTLAAAYTPALFERLGLVPAPKAPEEDVAPGPSTQPAVVFIVCGGFKISLEDMEEYKQALEVEAQAGGEWEVLCAGERWRCPR